MLMLYDEFDDKWDEKGYCRETDNDMDTEFNILFNDKDRKKKYVVRGEIHLWDGVYKGCNPIVYDSLKDAIIDSQYGFGICYTRVYEEDYGKLSFETIHHDGTNKHEIMELSEMGKELYEKGWSVKRIIKNDKSTRNVRLVKRLKNQQKNNK